MQPGLDDPAENLFFRNLLFYQRLMPSARTSHRMCGLFEDSPMLSRKTSGASTKTFLVPLWLHSLQVYRGAFSLSGHPGLSKFLWKTTFAVPVHMLRNAEQTSSNSPVLRPWLDHKFFLFSGARERQYSETISTRSFGFQPALFGGL